VARHDATCALIASAFFPCVVNPPRTSTNNTLLLVVLEQHIKKIFVVLLFKLLETGANIKDRAFSKTGPKHRLVAENKRLRRALEQEKDRYRRYLNSEIAADKLLEAELEPFRQGFSMGDIIEAQQKEIQKLRSELLTLHENNEVLQGSLGTALALQRVDSLATKGR